MYKKDLYFRGWGLSGSGRKAVKCGKATNTRLQIVRMEPREKDRAKIWKIDSILKYVSRLLN